MPRYSYVFINCKVINNKLRGRGSCPELTPPLMCFSPRTQDSASAQQEDQRSSHTETSSSRNSKVRDQAPWVLFLRVPVRRKK